MNIASNVKWDLDYRPDSYWEVGDPYRAILANIKGEQRKRQARELLEREAFGELNEFLTQVSLSDEDREMIGRIHPILMGGEYLPDYSPGEVEIARVSLASTTGDVISVRAKPAGDRIEVDVVDEYMDVFDEDEISWGFNGQVDQPLTMGELVQLMDETDPLCWELGGSGLVWGPLHANYGEESGWFEPDRAVRFVRVDSDFYPQLGAYYELRIAAWVEEERIQHLSSAWLKR